MNQTLCSVHRNNTCIHVLTRLHTCSDFSSAKKNISEEKSEVPRFPAKQHAHTCTELTQRQFSRKCAHTHTPSQVSTERSGLTRHQWCVLSGDRWSPSWDCVCRFVPVSVPFHCPRYNMFSSVSQINGSRRNKTNALCFPFIGELDLLRLLVHVIYLWEMTVTEHKEKSKEPEDSVRYWDTVSLWGATDRADEEAAGKKRLPGSNYCKRWCPMFCFCQHQHGLSNQRWGWDTCVRQIHK